MSIGHLIGAPLIYSTGSEFARFRISELSFGTGHRLLLNKSKKQHSVYSISHRRTNMVLDRLPSAANSQGE
jgi:hypothetical protein